eukprot:scaffold62213_cov63-Phaeocystis_antarctica.AAC.8
MRPQSIVTPDGQRALPVLPTTLFIDGGHWSPTHLRQQRSGWGKYLVLLAFLLALALGRLGADLLVVLLERGQVLAGLGKLSFAFSVVLSAFHQT